MSNQSSEPSRYTPHGQSGLKGPDLRNVVLVLLSIVSIQCIRNTDPLVAPPPPIIEKECTWNGVDSIDYLPALTCLRDFERLQGSPLQQTYANVKTVKIVYSISSDSVYFVESKKWPLHYHFCSFVLGDARDLDVYNAIEYGCRPDREYCLGSLNFYESSSIYTLEFFPTDCISNDLISRCFNRCRELTCFGPILKFMPSSSDMVNRTAPLKGAIPMVYADEIFKGQRYQALNLKEAFGYLTKIDASRIGSAYLGRHTLVLTNGIPSDIPVVSGIITTQFQTPLAHIAILSRNRGTPNMAYKSAWTDPGIASLVDKLVYLRVDADTFVLRAASTDEAGVFWNSHEPSTPTVLPCNDTTAGIFDLSGINQNHVSLVGAKAANFAELSRVQTFGGTFIRVPEGGFAIPFYYYRKHMREHGLDLMLDRILNDSLARADHYYRQVALNILRDSIERAPIDRVFLQSVLDHISERSTGPHIRFRSSTNAEDIPGFNGAGLYESHTGSLEDSAQSVEKAIKKVWSSLWTLRGVEERAYYRMDQKNVCMGILVHRSFKSEEANGVAITKNLYRADLPAMVVNVQIDEVSVVNPPQGFIADQFIFYLISEDPFAASSIEYISHSNVNGGKPVLTDGEIVGLCRDLFAIKWFFYLAHEGSGVYFENFGMDVEFKFDTAERKLYFKQARVVN